MRQWGLAIRLAMADLLAERLMASCTVLALAAVLAPLVILAGLRTGVVQGLRELLLQDPRAREIVTASNRSFDAALLAEIAARPDVEFLAPRTRTLAASLLIERPDASGAGIRVELIPTAPGDPLLPVGPTETDAVVLTASAAARLQVGVGVDLVGRLARVLDGRRENMPLALMVQAVAPPSAFPRDAAFVPLALAVLVEDYQDGRAASPDAATPVASDHPAPERPGPERQEFAGFRLYARRLEAVPALDAALQAQGIEVVSRAADIAGLLRIDRSLGLLFGLVAGLGGLGFLVSLGAGLWANVERKRVPLAQLRFLGLRAGSLRLFPMAQAAVLAMLGVAAASVAALAASVLVNRVFAGALALDRPLCLITPGLAATAAAITLAGAMLVAAIAGTRAARVEPWEGMSAP